MVAWQTRVLFAVTITVNFVILPYFLDMSATPKLFYFLISFLLIYLFFIRDYHFYLSLVPILLVLAVSTWLSPGLGYEKFSFFFLFFVLFLYLSAIKTLTLDGAEEPHLYFYRVFALLGVCVSSLGLYEYFSFYLLGQSRGMLIPYLLPSNFAIRVGGIYGQSNLFALLLLVCILVFFYLYLHDEGFQQCRYTYLKYLPFLLVCTVFFQTKSRSGLVALLLSYLLLLWSVIRKKYLAQNAAAKKRFLVLSLLLLAGAVIVTLLDQSQPKHALFARLADNANPIEARFVYWTAAILIFLDHPWFGIGLDNYKYVLSDYLNQAHELLGFVQYEAMGSTDWAHNELLQLLCEGGIFVFLIFALLLGGFFYQIALFLKGKKDWQPLFLYSHLLLLPFIIQSMFSWTLRYPALFILFATLLGLLLTQYPLKTIQFTGYRRYVVKVTVTCCLLLLLSVGYHHLLVGTFARQMDRKNIQGSFARFEHLVSNPYREHSLLLKLTPRYLSSALRDQDSVFAEMILPYVEESAILQGTHWQWYNLAMLLQLLERNTESKEAINNAIALAPTNDYYWAFLHYLNVLDASEKTGRPVSSFYTYDEEGSAPLKEFLEQLNVGNRMR